MLKIGSAWNKTSQQGKTYQSLNLKKESAPLIASGNYFITMHKVATKQSQNSPDYDVYATAKEETV